MALDLRDSTPDFIEEISSDEEDGPSDSRRAILEPIINRVANALGGMENGTYRLGHESYNCLKDLKKLWRKDDTDDERTVARIFWETKVLPNDLIQVLLCTAGQGMVEDKRAIVCVDLITAMTWPIDIAEELKELDEELEEGAHPDYTHLLQSHLHYKAALLEHPAIFQALLGIVVPPLSKPARERKQRDGQVINIVLHLIRNLAFIRDLPANIHASDEHIQFSTLQSKLVKSLSESRLMELLLTIAANSGNDPLLKSWNTIVLDIFYLILRSVSPEAFMPVAPNPKQQQQRKSAFHELLAKEGRLRQEHIRNAPSRHSRFGTAVALSIKPAKGDSEDTSSGGSRRQVVLNRQQAISGETDQVMDAMKKRKAKPAKKEDEVSVQANLSFDAKQIIRNTAAEFIKSAFNSFLASILKDIKSERPNVTEKDSLRLLFVAKWFLEFFLLTRARQVDSKLSSPWSFGLIGEVTEGNWMTWVLRRMRAAVEEKPKLWVELQAGIECLTQIILLTDAMTSVDASGSDVSEAANILQKQIIYNGDVLDLAFESLKLYKDRTHSLGYLDASVHLAYALMRMLEKMGKGNGEVYVRQKVKKRRKKAGADAEENEELGIEDKDDVYVDEIMFTFEAFEMRFAQSDVTSALLNYLARHKQFTNMERLKRVVGLLHRQAVKAKAEGLFFQVSTLDLLKSILSERESFPKEQPYTDLVNLIRYILRQFLKLVEKDPFVAIEAFFPKNRSNWKEYSSWEAPEKRVRAPKKKGEGAPGRGRSGKAGQQDIDLKEEYSGNDRIGIAVGALIRDNQQELVVWLQGILDLVIAQKRKVMENDDDEGVDLPPAEAIARFKPYSIPYTNDDQAEAATSNVWLRLLFRLARFRLVEQDEDEPEWYVPAALLPEELAQVRDAVRSYMETSYDFEGKTPWEMVHSKKRSRKRRRRQRSASDSEEDDSTKVTKKEEKKKQEKQIYKSAQFIEDSDEELAGMEEFLKLEEARRAKAEREAADSLIPKEKEKQLEATKSPPPKAKEREATDSPPPPEQELEESRKRGRGEEVEVVASRIKRRMVVSSDSE